MLLVVVAAAVAVVEVEVVMELKGMVKLVVMALEEL